MAERVHHALGVVPAWQPVLAARLPSGGDPGLRCAVEEDVMRAGIERRAAAQGLQPVRWPSPYPADTGWAMLVATWAAQIGRAVAFSLAAFRQAFAGGRDLSDRDNVLIAAAACELHPVAVAKGAGLESTRRRLDAAVEAAVAAGVREVPAVRIGNRVFHGDGELAAAAELLQRDATVTR
ncbi:MAG: hypothetical protein AVDCRST_MAG69-1655 [uncultured Solirubrobacteraceae bacterium]|uniref:DSBA-like thioredoxin domain-containing protein n=1 Tax=uncultured Solirubrobacteraceae bacterium TaxID=1162706 RepID=A0A6J4SIH6_9ACTN|nr:MAG: hypothetical protein AVDCRST_MAG69-1655 [uncultured Solirubrobacteraceae bacterium]